MIYKKSSNNLKFLMTQLLQLTKIDYPYKARTFYNVTKEEKESFTMKIVSVDANGLVSLEFSKPLVKLKNVTLIDSSALKMSLS